MDGFYDFFRWMDFILDGWIISKITEEMMIPNKNQRQEQKNIKNTQILSS